MSEGKNKFGYILPGVYTKEIWERGGKVKEHKKFIGKFYISWSSIESFNDKSGFNTSLLGEYEYMLNKFFEIKFPDFGWGDFGHQVENYITLRTDGENFTQDELKVLDTIVPLGNYQREVCLYMKDLDIIILGYIDDHSTPDENNIIEILRDYKTKSESSKKDLHLEKKFQLELYAMYLISMGYSVKKAEYVIIERLGGRECMNGGGRESLSVGNRVWIEEYVDRLTPKRFKEAEELVAKTVKKISSYYKTYLKLFVD